LEFKLDVMQALTEVQARQSALQLEFQSASDDQDSHHQLVMRSNEALSARLQKELRDELASLEARVGRQHHEFGDRISAAVGDLTAQQERFSLRLDRETASIKDALVDGISEMSVRLDRQRVEFSSELKAEASAVTAKCEEESCKVSANLSSLKSAIAERQSSLMIEMDTENRAMKMSIKTVVAETRDLQLGLATLRDEVAQDLQKRLHAHEQKQEAQLRLLAEDADERARVFVKDLEADRQQRCMREDAIQQDIQGWADTCGSLRGEVVGLRTLLLDQSVEASYRHEEADMAAVRDGLVAHTVLGGAAISAAVLL